MKENEPDKQPSLLVQLRPTAPCVTVRRPSDSLLLPGSLAAGVRGVGSRALSSSLLATCARAPRTVPESETPSTPVASTFSLCDEIAL